MHSLAVEPQDVEAARDRIAGAIVVTPTAESRTLSELTGSHVYVKFENLQFTASFKERGALNRLLQLSAAERERGVVAASAGNHAQAVAYHAGRLGIPATIVMPEGTPNVKVARTAAFGATVELAGASYDEASERAASICDRENLVPIHAFDDPAVIAGQGTVACEMLDAVDDLEVLVVPVGGGGLISGMVVAAKARSPAIEVVGVQAEQAPSMLAALGRPVPIAASCLTIADGIAVKHPGRLTTPIVEALVDEVLTVSESTIEQAVGCYLEIEKTVAEGAGAASLAALIEYPQRFSGRKVGLVLSGGNIDLRVLSTVIVRALARTGRLVRLRVEVDDLPGALGRLTTSVGEVGGNIVELVHRRDLPHMGLRRASVELTVETRDHRHVEQLVARLRSEGVSTQIEGPEEEGGPG